MCRFAGEIISDGEANVRENDSYMFNLDNKVGLELCLVKIVLKCKIIIFSSECFSYTSPSGGAKVY